MHQGLASARGPPSNPSSLSTFNSCLDLRQRSVVRIDVGAAEGAGEGHAHLDRSVGDRHHTSTRRSVYVSATDTGMSKMSPSCSKRRTTCRPSAPVQRAT